MGFVLASILRKFNIFFEKQHFLAFLFANRRRNRSVWQLQPHDDHVHIAITIAPEVFCFEKKIEILGGYEENAYLCSRLTAQHLYT